MELVASTCASYNTRYSSLFGVLNHCLTTIGKRTLRSSILQPPCAGPDIEARLNCVEELVDHPQTLTSIRVLLIYFLINPINKFYFQGILFKLMNIDQILSLSNLLARRNENNAETQLNYVLLLNSLLEVITPLHDVFATTKQSFFIQLREILSSEEFNVITRLLRTMIQNDAFPGKGSRGISQRCFAIKHGVNGLLDMVRKVYCERVDNLKGINVFDYVLHLSFNNNCRLC